MDEHTLICFSHQGCDVLLIGHHSGQLLPNKDQGKLMSLCRPKAGLVWLLLLLVVLHRGYSVHLRLVKVTATAHQRALGGRKGVK